MRLSSPNVALIFIVTSMLCDAAMAVDGDKLASQFQTVVRPFVRQHCLECHGAEDPAGKFDLSRLRGAEDVVKNFATWQHVADGVRAGEMPPVDSRQPTIDSGKAVLE
jgi:mono/diheme cytochrome c family protein